MESLDESLVQIKNSSIQRLNHEMLSQVASHIERCTDSEIPTPPAASVIFDHVEVNSTSDLFTELDYADVPRNMKGQKSSTRLEPSNGVASAATGGKAPSSTVLGFAEPRPSPLSLPIKDLFNSLNNSCSFSAVYQAAIRELFSLRISSTL